MISERTIENTLAGLQRSANLPPFTALILFLIVFISVMDAPEARSSEVSFSISSVGINGFSKRADPPPETRNRTISLLVRLLTALIASSVPLYEFSSGTGCPASTIFKLPIAPLL